MREKADVLTKQQLLVLQLNTQVKMTVIADRLCLSKERVRQIRAKAMRILRCLYREDQTKFKKYTKEHGLEFWEIHIDFTYLNIEKPLKLWRQNNS